MVQTHCEKNSIAGLPPKYLDAGFTTRSVLHITVDKDYAVFGMAVWKDTLRILISDDNGLPNWYPIELFSVKDARLPDDWLFAFFGNDESSHLQALWGYRNLVIDEQHYDALVERDERALAIFAQERAKHQDDESRL
ncbi:MAG: hypothetical protein WBY44_15375 [Bryobacteraceae bacterium]|jgi:hypothetical protein